jgi:transcriptional regulator GlxA family with amidase domain
MNNLDKEKILKAEGILVNSINVNFPGIDNLASQVDMSGTKFKQLFKLIFNKSPQQYYLHKKMLLAEQLLVDKTKSIREISTIMGYENAGKFSGMFKKQIGVLPSHV